MKKSLETFLRKSLAKFLIEYLNKYFRWSIKTLLKYPPINHKMNFWRIFDAVPGLFVG